jgi:hypothetical protein
MTLGNVGEFVANLLHPHPPSQTEARLRLLVGLPHWSQLHFLIMLSVVLSQFAAWFCHEVFRRPASRDAFVIW